MVDQQAFDQGRIRDFISNYLYAIEHDQIDVSNKRNTLKSKVKQLSSEFKIPRDFANYISLFLLVTRFFYIEDKMWKVNDSLKEKLDRSGFLVKNLFKFLFFTRDYNEYYKSPLVFNTVYANNDFEVINKRKSIVKTLLLFKDQEDVPFEQVYQTLIRRYAFFRDYNNPSKYYYTKGEVYNNKQFIFLFILKTLSFLGVVRINQKGKVSHDFTFTVTELGKLLITNFFMNEENRKFKRIKREHQVTLKPYHVSLAKVENQADFKLLFSSLTSQKTYTLSYAPLLQLNHQEQDLQVDVLKTVRNQIIERVTSQNIPNLLV